MLCYLRDIRFCNTLPSHRSFIKCFNPNFYPILKLNISSAVSINDDDTESNVFQSQSVETDGEFCVTQYIVLFHANVYSIIPAFYKTR